MHSFRGVRVICVAKRSTNQFGWWYGILFEDSDMLSTYIIPDLFCILVSNQKRKEDTAMHPRREIFSRTPWFPFRWYLLLLHTILPFKLYIWIHTLFCYSMKPTSAFITFEAEYLTLTLLSLHVTIQFSMLLMILLRKRMIFLYNFCNKQRNLNCKPHLMHPYVW